MQLHIDPHDLTPVYRQIERQIAQAIAERRLSPGEALQTEEQLAAQLVVSPAAVRKAYEHLESEGLCEGSNDKCLRVADSGVSFAADGGKGLAPAFPQHELLAGELRTARETQKRLLPPQEVRSPSWMVTARSLPAGALAGDFYDLIEADDHRMTVVVGDAAGKGVAAGLVMAVVKSMLPFATQGNAPDAAMREINGRLFSLLGRREFVALCIATLDPSDGSLAIANAGLPDPYLLRVGGWTENLAVPGERLPLGVKQEVPYSLLRISIAPGDRLLMITDGIAEATDHRGEPLGYHRLTRILEAARKDDRLRSIGDGCTRSLPDRLIELVSNFSGPTLEDDWTAVLLEYIRS